MMKSKRIFASLPAALAVIGLCEGLELTGAERCGLWSIALLALTAVGIWRWMKLPERRLQGYAAVFGFGLSLCLLLGQRMERIGSVGGGGMLWLLLSALCLAPAAGSLFAAWIHFVRTPRAESAAKWSDRRFFLMSLLVLFLGWLVIFLSLYPGVFAYDALNQLVQGVDAPYSKHHPLLHTLMMNAFIRWGQSIGNANLGIAVNALVQMLLMGLSAAYGLTVIRREGCPRAVYLAALAVLTLLPIHGTMAVSTAKDPLFAAAVLWTATLLFEGMRTPSNRRKSSPTAIFSADSLRNVSAQARKLPARPAKPVDTNKSQRGCGPSDTSLGDYRQSGEMRTRTPSVRWWLCLLLATALTCLTRNNGLYALAVLLVLGLMLCRRHALRCLCAVLAGIVLSFGVNAGLDAALQPKSGKSREMLSVPIQQMARVATLHPEWQQDEDFQALFQGELEYEPLISDPAKEIFRTDGETPISQVIRLWLRMLRAHPDEYVDAFLLLTRGWWDLADLTHSTIYGDWAGYMQLNVFGGQGVERKPLLPFMAGFYENLLQLNGYQQIPVFSLLFSPALWIWFMLFTCMAALYTRRREALLPALLLLGVTATIMLGPCAIMRYAYPVMFGMPVVFGMLCAREKQ